MKRKNSETLLISTEAAEISNAIQEGKNIEWSNELATVTEVTLPIKVRNQLLTVAKELSIGAIMSSTLYVILNLTKGNTVLNELGYLNKPSDLAAIVFLMFVSISLTAIENKVEGAKKSKNYIKLFDSLADQQDLTEEESSDKKKAFVQLNKSLGAGGTLEGFLQLARSTGVISALFFAYLLLNSEALTRIEPDSTNIFFLFLFSLSSTLISNSIITRLKNNYKSKMNSFFTGAENQTVKTRNDLEEDTLGDSNLEFDSFQGENSSYNN